MRFQVANRSEHVVLEGGTIKVRLARTGRAAESTEIDCQDSKSSQCQSPSLLPPALLIESATVSEQNGAGALAIEIGANSSAVFAGKRRSLLCGHQRSKHKGQGHPAKDDM